MQSTCLYHHCDAHILLQVEECYLTVDTLCSFTPTVVRSRLHSGYPIYCKLWIRYAGREGRCKQFEYESVLRETFCGTVPGLHYVVHFQLGVLRAADTHRSAYHDHWFHKRYRTSGITLHILSLSSPVLCLICVHFITNSILSHHEPIVPIHIFQGNMWQPASEEVYGLALGYLTVCLVALIPGYFFAVMSVDIVGRKLLQFSGFVIMAVWCAACSGSYTYLTNPNDTDGSYSMNANGTRRWMSSFPFTDADIQTAYIRKTIFVNFTWSSVKRPLSTSYRCYIEIVTNTISPILLNAATGWVEQRDGWWCSVLCSSSHPGVLWPPRTSYRVNCSPHNGASPVTASVLLQVCNILFIRDQGSGIRSRWFEELIDVRYFQIWFIAPPYVNLYTPYVNLYTATVADIPSLDHLVQHWPVPVSLHRITLQNQYFLSTHHIFECIGPV